MFKVIPRYDKKNALDQYDHQSRLLLMHAIATSLQSLEGSNVEEKSKKEFLAGAPTEEARTKNTNDASFTQIVLPLLMDYVNADTNSDIQKSWLVVIKEALHRSLVHPLPYLPTILALSIAGDAKVVAPVAHTLYASMAQKHRSFVHTRDINGVILAFDYMRQFCEEKEESQTVITGYTVNDDEAKTVSSKWQFLIDTLFRSSQNPRKAFEHFVTNLLEALDKSSGYMPLMAKCKYFMDALMTLKYPSLECILFLVNKLMHVVSIDGDAEVKKKQPRWDKMYLFEMYYHAQL